MPTVTSANKADFDREFMEKNIVKKIKKEDKPKNWHGIFHKESDKIHGFYPSGEEAHKSYSSGKYSPQSDFAIGKLTESEIKEHKLK